MKRFKKILFVNDGITTNTQALEKAVNLALSNKAGLTVVEVLDEFPADIQRVSVSSGMADIRTAVTEESYKRLNDLIAPIKKEGISVSGNVLWGTSWLEIIREVLRNNHDLVMLSPQNKGKFMEMLFGSRIMHLMRKCPCPVWAIKPTRKRQYTRIVAAVNAVPEEDKETLLNMKIMELATSMAQSETKSELHIVHCWTQFFQKRIRGRTILNQEQADSLNREAKKTQSQWLDRLVEKFNLEGISCKIHLLPGEPSEIIPQLADKKKIDIVVMGTVARTGLSGFFIGNTAERILQALDCSVLAVKPDGFETPVKIDSV
ncbi:MAG: universal stress protein [Deltaproteobacteria bacterium]|nr:universal stress protein [Deltaproteobacteria bacterium]